MPDNHKQNSYFKYNYFYQAQASGTVPGGGSRLFLPMLCGQDNPIQKKRIASRRKGVFSKAVTNKVEFYCVKLLQYPE